MPKSPVLNKVLDGLWWALVACVVGGLITLAAAGIYAEDSTLYEETKDGCVIQEANDNEWFFEDSPTVKTKLCPEE